jgi:23S rRNA pseudouridine1911/1915/1917 synthase
MKTITLHTAPKQKPIRLDVLLVHQIDHLSRTRAQAHIKEGLVKVDGKLIRKPSYQLEAEHMIEVTLPTRQDVTLIPQDIPLDIIYEDHNVVVINKPAGLVVHPAFGNWEGTLANALLYHINNEAKKPISKKTMRQGNQEIVRPAKRISRSDQSDSIRPGIIHRLDKDTSGIMVIAKSDQAKQKLQQQFKKRTIHKSYIALVEGRLEPTNGTIDAPIGRDARNRKKMWIRPDGKSALTEYEVIEYIDSCPAPDEVKENVSSYTLVRVVLKTGRTHQIRVHFASIGHPVVGDATYGHAHANLERQFLHADSLALKLPDAAEQTIWHAPLPEDLITFLHDRGVSISSLTARSKAN